MKILMVHNRYNSVGGEDVSVATEVRGLRDAGHQVAEVYVENRNLDQSRTRAGLIALSGSSVAVEQLRTQIVDNRPDVIHLQNLFPQLGARALQEVVSSRVPWFRTIRNLRMSCVAATHFREGQDCFSCTPVNRLPGIQHGCYRHSRFGSAVATGYALRELRAQKRELPHSFIAPSEFISRYIRRLLPDATVHIKPNTVSAVSPKKTTERRFSVGFVGRATPEKGADTFLNLMRAAPGLEFVHVGPSAGLPALPNLTSLGILPQHEVLAAMAATRFVVVPSKWDEPFGRVAIEAMSQGAVPLVSNRGGLPEIAVKVDPRLVCLSADSELLSGALSLIHIRPDEFARLSQKAREVAESHYSLQATTERLVQIYSSAVASRRGRRGNGG